MAIGKEMAVGGTIMIARNVGRGLYIAILAFFLTVENASAAPPSAPVIEDADWRTGEVEVKYTGAIPGATIKLFARQYRQNDWVLWETWIAEEPEESHIAKYFENGQTVWYRITQVDPMTNEESPPSNAYKVTPPITAFIINWPEMFDEITMMVNNANQQMMNFFEGLATPSDQAMSDLQNALDDLKNALGVGQVGQAGNSLQDGFGNIGSGLSPPVVVDDGDGTFTGGPSGGNLPFPKGEDNLGLIAPNPDSGTDTELTMRIPYMVDMDGELIYMKIFTKEQMEKMKWLDLLRTLAAATIYILFAMWLVSRFAPILKS